jgi:crotonobetainyl-CoA:carnitine CoA-transferase CaiB-like acyl-CoA transferase
MTTLTPLAGTTVVELAHWAAGPAVGGVLADWGADVTKIEPAVGDPMRSLFPPPAGSNHSTSFAALNRGKQSRVVDMASDAGRNTFENLLVDADVLITNLRPSALERLGLGPEATAARHPQLVCCSVTAYGWEGPDRDQAGYDLAGFYARAGVLHQLTPEGAAPAPYMNGVGDMFTAMSAVAGVLAALNERHTTGVGGFVEASLLRTGMWSIGGEVALAANGGKPQPVADRTDSRTPLFNVYKASDGAWFVLVGAEADRHLPAVLAAIGRPELIEDPRFCDARAVRKNRREFIGILDDAFGGRTLAEWLPIFADHDVWWGPIQSLEQLAGDPQAEAAGAWIELADTGVRVVDAPVRFDRLSRERAPDAPVLGSSTGPNEQ